MPARSKSQQRLFGMVHAYKNGKIKDAPEEVKRIAGSISDESAEHFAKTKHKGLPEKKEKKAADRLYTYLPKDNTALTEGLLSTALSDRGFEKYRGRTGKYKKEDVLKVLDSWEPEWTRSKAISALTEPIPEDAAEDFLEFARNRRLYSFSVKDLIKAKILAHIRRARKGGGTDPVDEAKKERPNWHRKKKHLLFQGVPHYMVETTGGRIPPEFVREEKKAETMDDIEAKARRHYPEEGSHGWNHIQDVLANARRMRRRELLKKELAAIMYHDSSLMTGDRETHADDSAEIARKELAGLFRKRQLADIVNAIAHHRASYEGVRNSRLEDLVAAADRPVPDLAKQVARSWKYHEELGEPEGLRSKNVAEHLKEKYGHGGYAYGNAPKLYLKTYGRELRDIMSKFDGLTPESVVAIMSGAEKKASAKIDIPALYEDVRRAYADMGYPVSGDRLVLSEQPTYIDGRPVPKDVINPRSSGGNTQDDGTVRINPRYRAVMRHWKIKGPGRDFLRKIIWHELGHHVDKSVLSKPERAEERKRLLREIVKAKFHTVYTDSYGPDTDPRKLDKELLAEYLADMVKRKLEKKAAAPSASIAASPAGTTPVKTTAPAVPYPAEGPRGFKQHNPGNLQSNGKTLWDGATGVPAKGEDLTFVDPKYGIRAMARLAYNYKAKHGIDTPRKFLKRYAKTTDYTNYLKHIKDKTGFGADQAVDFTNVDTLQKFIPAVGSFEIGPKYWNTYSPSMVSNAVSMAVSGR